MKKINYSDYSNTKDPFSVPNYNRLFEGKGIPNILKKISNEIYLEIIKNNFILNGVFNYNYDDFNINLLVEIVHEKRDDVYAKYKYDGSYSIKIFIDVDKLNNVELKRVITHELLHIYELFNRNKKNSKTGLQLKLGGFILDAKDKCDSEFVDDFSYMIYLSLDQEINSRVAETYTVLMDIKSSDESLLMSELKKTLAWKYSNFLINFNKNQYKIDYSDLTNFLIELNMSVLGEFRKLNFNIYDIPKNKKECDDIVKDWCRIFKKKGRYFQSKLMKIIDEVVTDVKLIESAVYVDNPNPNCSFKNRHILKYDKFLERDSKISKILRLDENYDIDKQIYDSVMDSIKMNLIYFVDDGWVESNYLPFPNFCYVLTEPADVNKYKDRLLIDLSGEIDSDGNIKYDSDIDETYGEDTDDFIAAVKQINSETGLDFRFSIDNNRDGDRKIIINGRI